MIPLYVMRSLTGAEAFAMIPSNEVDAVVLASGVAEAYTVPTGAHALAIIGDGAFYARPNGTAAVPAADVTDGTSSILISEPVIWVVDNKNEAAQDAGGVALTTIGFIASATRVITIQVFSR
jgi:hypothetical protein